MATICRSNVCLALLVCLLLCTSAVGQSSGSGALTGTVTDPSGAILPNVTVTATNSATGQVRTATTGGDGVYKLTLLQPGHYNVKFVAAGFKAAEMKGITVIVTESAVLNAKLQVGERTEQVNVEADAEAIQTSTSAVGGVIAGQTVTELPLSTRNFTNLLGLSAGAAADVNNASNLGKGSQFFRVNGSGYLNNTFSMDGSVVNNFVSNGTTENGTNSAFGIPNPDAIQEFKVQTSNYDASYGRNSGANVNVVTKSGTNQFHGSIFEFFRNSALNANDFFNKYSQLAQGQANKQQPLNQHQFGGSFGGPLKKDKLFFFLSYQQTNQKNGASPYGYSSGIVLPHIPSGDRSTAAFRQALGAAFANEPTAGKVFGIPGGGVQVAADGSNINPVALAVLNLKKADGSYYIPSITTNAPLAYSIPAIYKEYQGIGNVDYLITPKHTLATRYFFATDPTNAAFPCGLGFPGPCLPGSPIFTEYGNQSASTKLTSVLTNSFLNEVRVSYQRSTVNNSPEIPYTNNQIGMQPIQQDVPGMSNIWFLPIASRYHFDIGTHPFFQQTEAINQYSFGDTVSWTKGKHTVRFGGEIERDQWNWNDPGISVGLMIFPTFSDFLVGLSACPAGSFVPSFVGIPGTCNETNPMGTNGTPLNNIIAEFNANTRSKPGGIRYSYRSSAYDLFFQDDFRVTSRLTLNLGLRWEYFPALWDKDGQNTNIWRSQVAKQAVPGNSPATGTFLGYVVPANYVGPTLPTGVLKTDSNSAVGPMPKNNFAPRLGFAWQPLPHNDNLVVRGGGGFFYDRVPGSAYIWATNQSVPYAYTIPFNVSSATLAQPFDQTPLGWNTPRWVDFTTGASSNITQPVLSENLLTPVVYSWNFGIQYQLKRDFVVDLGYVGSRGVHQLSFNENYPNFGRLATVANPINGITTSTASNVATRTPLLGISPLSTYTGNDGDMKYNSLQASLKKKMSFGLQFQASYTWSKTLHTGGTDRDDPPHIDFNTGKLIYGSLYRPHRMSVVYSYDFPYTNQNGAKGKLLGGWGISGTTVMQAGSPLNIQDSSGATVYFGTASSLARAQYASGAGPGNVGASGDLYTRVFNGLQGTGGFFNPSAFGSVPSLAGGDTLSGNVGLGIIRGPGQNNWDLAFTKTTKVGGINEGATLNFRAEFFNVWNHTQFANPDTDRSSGTFGQINKAAVNPRILQFAVKYIF